jgi:hypothetical protein
MKEIIKYENPAPFTLWQINALYDVSANLDFIDSSDLLLAIRVILHQRKENRLSD